MRGVTSSHCKVVVQFVGLGYSEHTIQKQLTATEDDVTEAGSVLLPSLPRTPSHHFPWAGFQVHLHNQWGQQARPPGNCSLEIKNKEGLFPAARAAGLSLPGQDGTVCKQGGTVGQPFQQLGTFQQFVPPRNPSLEIPFLFHCETQIGLTVKWNYPLCTIHAGPFKPFHSKLNCLFALF